MAYWLMKTEPDVFSYADLERLGLGCWDGVRNYAARNHLRSMQVGDHVLVYHSNLDKAAVGVARVVRSHYPDPTIDDPRWSAVDVAPVRRLVQPVTLAAIKAEVATGGVLRDLRMIKENRLSVSPVTDMQWSALLAMAATPWP
ncbi:MAG: EVE domain-containing protein [Deltaproteobacteria bacterium]|nr:EVE domain-containing protein [Deltaproteobacteria bacterium]